MTGESLRSIEDIISAAETHGSFEDPDHETGDLQNVLRAAWALMTIDQKKALVECAAVTDIFDAIG